MTETTIIFVGLDVHKKTIAVVTVEGRASADVRFFGTIANTPEAIRSLLRKLGKGGQPLHLAYEQDRWAIICIGWQRGWVTAATL